MTPLHTPAVVDALATDLRAAAYTTDGVAELLGADAGAFSRGLSWSALRATERAPGHQRQLAVLVRLLLLGTEESRDRVAGALPTAGVDALVADYEIVADGSDNFATRFLLNDACFRARRTLVSAAIQQFDGQLATFKPHAGPDQPCYRCLHPEAPPEELDAACVEAGVLGALAGVMGSLQAAEVLKEILEIGTGLAGRLMLYDAMNAEFRTIRLRRNPACPLCAAD